MCDFFYLIGEEKKKEKNFCCIKKMREKLKHKDIWKKNQILCIENLESKVNFLNIHYFFLLTTGSFD